MSNFGMPTEVMKLFPSGWRLKPEMLADAGMRRSPTFCSVPLTTVVALNSHVWFRPRRIKNMRPIFGKAKYW